MFLHLGFQYPARMNIEEIRQIVTALLREGKIDQALEFLVEQLQNAPSQQHLMNDAVMLQANYAKARRQHEVQGLLPRADFELIQNRTISGVQTILSQLGIPLAAAPSTADSTRSNRKPWLWPVVGLVIVLLAAGLWWALRPAPQASKPELEKTQETVSQTANQPSNTGSQAGGNTASPPKSKPESSPSAPAQPQKKEPPATTPAKTYRVTLVLNSAWSGANISVDGQRADVLKSSLSFKEILVTEKNTSHVFRLEKPGAPPCEKAQRIVADTRITMTCN